MLCFHADTNIWVTMKSVLSLKRISDQMLSSGLMLVTFVTTHHFQLSSVHTVQYWHSYWLACRLTIANIYKMVEDPAAYISLFHKLEHLVTQRVRRGPSCMTGICDRTGNKDLELFFSSS